MTAKNDESNNDQSKNGVHTFKLGEVVDISMVNSLYDALKILLTEANQVVIDTRAVKRLDTAAMQLILCWYRETKSRDIQVTWKNTDGVFSNSARLLGLSKELSLEQH